ncbi:putative ketoreductase [Paramyrothecium foliicola]|nr:putative ketoreductase [Paramyrothecium foliicola]
MPEFSAPRSELLTLQSGALMPKIIYGAGTAWFKDGTGDGLDHAMIAAVKTALDVGFRGFDCAQMYGTERELGQALKESLVARRDIFLTTKTTALDNVEAALEASLENLQTPFVDMYMIHSPFSATSYSHLQSAWKSMENCVKRGLARNIGVSNFSPGHMRTILEKAEIKPTLCQMEMHPYLQQTEMLEFLRQNNIQAQGFAALTPMRLEPSEPALDVCRKLAEKYGVSDSAILLKWVLDQGVSVVTTSSSKTRLEDCKQTLGKFQLEAAELAAIGTASNGKHFRGFFADEFRSLDQGRGNE